jgi:hypothetical protein
MIKKRRKAVKKVPQVQCVPCKISLMAAIVFAALAGVLVYLSLETVRIKDRKTMQSLRYSQAQYLEQLSALDAKVRIYESAPPDRQIYISDPIATDNGEIYVAQDNKIDIYFQNGQVTKLLQSDIPANTHGSIPPRLSSTNGSNIVELKTISSSDGAYPAYYYINTENFEVFSVEVNNKYYLNIETPLKINRIEPWLDCNDENICKLKGLKTNNEQFPIFSDNEYITAIESNSESVTDFTTQKYTLEYLGIDLYLEEVYFNVKITNESLAGDQIIEDINLSYNLKNGSLTESEPDFLLKSKQE